MHTTMLGTWREPPSGDRRESRESAGARVGTHVGRRSEADRVAALVPLREGAYFMRQRRAIRDALAADGIATRIDTLVAQLLDR
jgi:hypothetical protein